MRSPNGLRVNDILNRCFDYKRPWTRNGKDVVTGAIFVTPLYLTARCPALIRLRLTKISLALPNYF